MRTVTNRFVTVLFTTLILAIGATVAAPAHADYLLPESDAFIARDDFAIAIVEVEGFDDTVAQIDVEATLHGVVTDGEVASVAYSCLRGRGLAAMGVDPDTRYVMLFLGPQMAEEQSYFEVDDDGVVDLRNDHWMTWFGFETKRVPLTEFEARIAELAT